MKSYYDDKLKDEVYYASDIIEVVSASPLKDYKLMLSFSNKESRIYNVAPLLEKPAFKALKNLGLFNMAHVECGTVVWNDDLDLAPELLYKNSLPIAQ